MKQRANLLIFALFVAGVVALTLLAAAQSYRALAGRITVTLLLASDNNLGNSGTSS